MDLTKRQAIEIICSYFRNDLNKIIMILQRHCDIPKYLFENDDSLDPTQNADIFLQTIFYKLSNKEKNSIYEFAYFLREGGTIDLEIDQPNQPKTDDDNIANSTNDNNYPKNIINNDTINLEIMNIATLSELAMFINSENDTLQTLITKVESAMMHGDKESYFQFLLELFNNLAENKIIPPLIPNTLVFVQDHIKK